MRYTAMVLAAFIVVPAHAQQDEVKEFLDRVNPPIVYRVPGAESVRIRRDIAYKHVDGKPLLADVYRPRSDGRAPVVIFIHGGMGADFPVRPKEWGMFQSWGRSAAASGMVAITFNHRLGFPEPYLREAASDLADLITYVRANSAELGADGNRICLAAYSAGGPLLSAALRDKPPYIRCLVSIYNFLDVSQTPEHSKFEPADVVREFSPITHLSPSIPPMLIVRAGNDQIPTLNDSIARFVQKAVAVNAPITLMVHPTAPHGFDNKTDDDRSREIIRGVFDFLKWHLRPV